jgi:outer membrane immunogenic protein
MNNRPFGALAPLVLAGALLVCAAAPVSAADDSSSESPGESSSQWTGFYIGGHATDGYSQSRSTSVDLATGVTLAPTSGNTSSFYGGGQIGYNYTLPSNLVVGGLADVSSGSSNTTTTNSADGTSVVQNKDRTKVRGTVRALLGYADQSLLYYGTAGLAWNSGSSTRTQLVGITGVATPGTIETADTHSNGWTVGAGLGWEFVQNWNVFGEYRYVKLSDVTITYPFSERITTTSTSANTIEFGVNYIF